MDLFDTPEGDSFNNGYYEESSKIKEVMVDIEDKLRHYSWKSETKEKTGDGSSVLWSH